MRLANDGTSCYIAVVLQLLRWFDRSGVLAFGGPVEFQAAVRRLFTSTYPESGLAALRQKLLS